MLETSFGLLAVLALVLTNGFFVAAEFGLVQMRRTRVAQMVDEGRAGAGNLHDAVAHLDSYIAACQLGITGASLALGWIGEWALAGLLDPLLGSLGAHAASVTVIFVMITALLVVAGELAPKGVALQYPERVALAVATPLRVFRALFRPAIWALNRGGWIVARTVGVRADVGEDQFLDASELLHVIEASTDAGELADEDRFLMARVLRFRDLTAAEVMVPRTELVALPVETSGAEALRIIADSHHTRYPVYRDSIDNVVGVLHVRDLVLADEAASIESILRQPLIVPGQASVRELLAEMRERKTHFAIAVDEYGGTDGIITLEDVLEEIVGELQDEFEQEPPAIERSRDGTVRLDGLTSADALEELLGVPIDAGPYKTVAGYIVEQIGRIPDVGDSVELESHRMTVVEMDGRRIASVEVEPLPVSAQPDGATESTSH